jgi:hypothetical protein
MGIAIVIIFALLIGPAAVLYGADSRRADDRGWIGSRH